MGLVALVLFGSGFVAVAADSSPIGLVTKAEQSTFVVAQNDLPGLQARLDGLKQQVSLADSLSQLVSLQDLIQTYLNDVERQQSALQPVQAQLQAQLGSWAPPPLTNRRRKIPTLRSSASISSSRKTSSTAV